MYGTDENAAQCHPEQGSQPSEIQNAQERTEYGAGPRDGGEMMPEQDILPGGRVVDAVFQFSGRSGLAVIRLEGRKPSRLRQFSPHSVGDLFFIPCLDI